MNVTKDYTLMIVAQNLNIWFGLFLLIIGNVGCLVNIIVFRSKSFDKSSFSIYFLATTCADFCLLNFVLFTRILQNGFMLHIFQTYEYMCQARAYLSSLTSILSFSFFIMISIDRFLATHPQASYRAWANRYSLAMKMIPCITLFWMIILSHRLVLYRFNPISGICEPQLNTYWWYNSYYKFISTGLIPPIVILIVGSMLIRNIRRIIDRRIRPLRESVLSIEGGGGGGKPRMFRLRKLNNQLTSILLIQLSTSFISFIPYNSELIYSTLSQNLIKSNSYLAWEHVFIQFIHLSSYIFYSTNCYVFLLSSPLFRRPILQLLSSSKKFNDVQNDV